MSEIKLNQEMISALQNCKDAKAIMALAKSKGIEISEAEAGEQDFCCHTYRRTF